jgi:hypothetical protein
LNKSESFRLIEKRGHDEENGFQNWDGEQCRDYLQYKKRDTDKAMPKTLSHYV